MAISKSTAVDLKRSFKFEKGGGMMIRIFVDVCLGLPIAEENLSWKERMIRPKASMG
jgi:hypothetical protein